ncbi:MAG: AAA family ATPase [Myxococcales bacterium]|jgi:SpoVK/Ycf46/Vps4 family AAA+-type ATPase
MSAPASAPQSPQPPCPPPFVQDLDVLVRARYPLIYLVTWEEQRLDTILQQMAAAHGKALYFWSITKGLRKVSGARAFAPLENTHQPPEALAAIEKLTEASLVVLKDFHPYLDDPVVVRAMRELAHALKSTFTTVIILSPKLDIPLELEKEVTVLDVPLPTARDLYNLLCEIVSVVRQGNRATVDLRKDQVEQIIKAALGLTLSEAENAFAKAIATDGRLDAADVALVLEEKRQVIRKSGLLEYFPPEEDLRNIGGLDNLKIWLQRRANAFGEQARRFGLPEPKGLLLLGVQGCGKSLTAKAIASQWRLPLLRLDMGRIFSGLVGSSEENLRKAIRVAESVAPVVLWVDEIEKGLAGLSGPSGGDGGVSARVFGTFLTWLQEKTAPVFVVATANKIENMPPELVRKGRFDEIFFVDLPMEAERRQIVEIHLRRRKRDPQAFDTAEIAGMTQGFSGAEIEQAVVSALYDAFAEGTDLQQRHVVVAIRETVPLSKTMSHEIVRLREWAKTRTRPASALAVEPSMLGPPGVH